MTLNLKQGIRSVHARENISRSIYSCGSQSKTGQRVCVLVVDLRVSRGGLGWSGSIYQYVKYTSR